MLARGEHRDDRFGASNRFSGRCYTRAARFDGARERLFAEVEGADVVARLREVRGHAAAHVAESDKGDFHIFSPPACGRGRGRACPEYCTGEEATGPPLTPPASGRGTRSEEHTSELQSLMRH